MAVANIERDQQRTIYQSKFAADDGEITREFEKNKIAPENRTVGNIFAEINGRSKGVADSFALIGRSTKFVTPYLPKEMADWTQDLSTFVLNARSVLSIPNMFRAGKEFYKKITFRSTCDLLATSCHASAVLLRGAMSKTISSIGSIFKALIDCYDCVETGKKFFETRELCSLARGAEGASPEVTSALDSLWYEQLYKIVKYSLAAISGLVAGFVFCTGMALPLAVGTAVLAASVVSAIFSIASDYVHESADYVEFKA